MSQHDNNRCVVRHLDHGWICTNRRHLIKGFPMYQVNLIYNIKLPYHLNPTTWLSYKYSTHDVHTTLKRMRIDIILLLASVMGVSASLPGKSRTIDKILDATSHYHEKNLPNVLSEVEFKTNPPLPHISVDSAELSALIVKFKASQIKFGGVNYSDNLIRIMNKLFFMYEVSRTDAIHCIRVVSSDKYVYGKEMAVEKEPSWLRFSVIFDGSEYISTDEGVVIVYKGPPYQACDVLVGTRVKHVQGVPGDMYDTKTATY